MESFIFSILLKLPPFYMISSKMLNKRIYQYMPFFFIYCYKTGDCKTTIFYVKVIQKQQNNAGTLSLRSARSGTKFATSRSLSTDGRTYVFVSFESLNISFGSFAIAYCYKKRVTLFAHKYILLLIAICFLKKLRYYCANNREKS